MRTIALFFAIFISCQVFAVTLITDSSGDYAYTSTNGELIATADNYESGWVRPFNWPVGAGYTPETWVIPESNVVKVTTLAVENIGLLVAAGDVSIDWLGDGSMVSNYPAWTWAFNYFAYPASMRGKYVNTIIHATSLEAGQVQIFSDTTSTEKDLKTHSIVELICSKEGSGGYQTVPTSVVYLDATFSNVNTLKQLHSLQYVGLNISVIPAYMAWGNDSLKEAVLPGVTNFEFSSMYSCSQLRRVYAPGTVVIGEGAFANDYSLESLSMMPGLRTVGATPFYRCNFSYPFMTNFMSHLPDVTAAPQTFDWSTNPGAAELRAWYTNGVPPATPSNSLASKGWFVLTE